MTDLTASSHESSNGKHSKSLDIVVLDRSIEMLIYDDDRMYLCDRRIVRDWPDLLPWLAKYGRTFDRVSVVSQISRSLFETLTELTR